jgi:hypothetical protein
MKFKRPCDDCHKMYRPTGEGRNSKYCDSCLKKRYIARAKKMRETNKAKKKKGLYSVLIY